MRHKYAKLPKWLNTNPTSFHLEPRYLGLVKLCQNLTMSAQWIYYGIMIYNKTFYVKVSVLLQKNFRSCSFSGLALTKLQTLTISFTITNTSLLFSFVFCQFTVFTFLVFSFLGGFFGWLGWVWGFCFVRVFFPTNYKTTNTQNYWINTQYKNLQCNI